MARWILSQLSVLHLLSYALIFLIFIFWWTTSNACLNLIGIFKFFEMDTFVPKFELKEYE